MPTIYHPQTVREVAPGGPIATHARLYCGQGGVFEFQDEGAYGVLSWWPDDYVVWKVNLGTNEQTECYSTSVLGDVESPASNLIAVPEPAGIAPLLVGIALLYLLNKRGGSR